MSQELRNPTPAEIQELLNSSEQATPINPLLGSLETFGHGASIGTTDEMAGSLDAALGGDYTSARDAARARIKAFSQQYPMLSTGSEVAGGLAGGLFSTLKLPGLLAQIPKVGRQIENVGTTLRNRAMQQGAGRRYLEGLLGTGGVAGGFGGYTYGEGETPSEVAKDIGIGSLTGMAGFGILHPFSQLAMSTYRNVAPLIADQFSKALSPEDRLSRELNKRMIMDEQTPESLLEAGTIMGDEGTIVDIPDAGNLQMLGRVFANLPGEAKKEALTTFNARANTMQSRVMKDLMDILGEEGSGVNVVAVRKELSDKLENLSPQYARILNANEVDMTPELETILRTPRGQKLLKRAQVRASDELESPISVELKYKEVDGEEIAEFADRPTLRVFQYMLEELNDDIESNLARKPNIAASFLTTKKALTDELDKNTDFKNIRQQWASAKSQDDAFKLGDKFATGRKEEAEVLENVLEDMTEAEQRFFKLGVVNSLQRKLQDKPADKPITPLSVRDEQRITSVFGNNDGKKIINRYNTERGFGETRKAFFQGSQTTPLATETDEVAGSASNLQQILSLGFIKDLMTNPKYAIPREYRDEASRVLYSPLTNVSEITGERVLNPRIKGLLDRTNPLVRDQLLDNASFNLIGMDDFGNAYRGLLGGTTATTGGMMAR
tara:strand:- start:8983 stop:10986 length:2004 start_codon:yes stop_codon:yes gene_type:complete